MRLDKFLKVCRIIKRRTVANEVSDAGRVLVNNIEKKPSYSVKKGDIIETKIYDKSIKVKVIEVPDKNLKKEDIENYIEIIG
ncbi:S4 domain-containing protein [Oceanivirga miroungae]|uniref:RQC P-site tRNA stabilizing factor n=1 Tax=Oceanivirga miroungae TaxID=1130046 RepID=A0A6I8M952_9FUSO|nr:S4 domain-containing protein [Oceanivirga miroungae]VWL84818.1 RNA-binding S4 domain-containing protein [Oceanivirga miroungae]